MPTKKALQSKLSRLRKRYVELDKREIWAHKLFSNAVRQGDIVSAEKYRKQYLTIVAAKKEAWNKGVALTKEEHQLRK